MSTIEMREAAVKRAEGVRAPGDRPSQRRCEREAQSRAWTPGHSSRVEIRDADGPDGPLVFDGFASVTGQGYEMWDWAGEYTEVVHVGAFAETLARGDLDVPLVLDHVSSKRIARTGNASSPLMLAEVTEGDTTGLHVLAPTLDRTDPDTAYIVPKLRSGLIDEMSFRFMITSGRWSEDWMEYHIHAVDIHRGDVSIVGYGANPHTVGAGLRSKLHAASDDDLRAEVERRGLVPAQPPGPVRQSLPSDVRALLELGRAEDDKYRHLSAGH
jgi:HK97 family phage prohead protease